MCRQLSSPTAVHAQPVGDGPRRSRGRVPHRRARRGAPALGQVACQLRLDADHPRLRRARLDRHRDAADQAAAAHRDVDRAGSGRSATISSPTVPWPAITSRVVERRHEDGPGLGPDPVDASTRARPTSTSTTSRPERLGRGALHRRRRRAASRSSPCTPRARAARATACAWLPDECVMTPRARSSAVSCGDRVDGAAQLERAAELQALGLEVDGSAPTPEVDGSSGVRRTQAGDPRRRLPRRRSSRDEVWMRVHAADPSRRPSRPTRIHRGRPAPHARLTCADHGPLIGDYAETGGSTV